MKHMIEFYNKELERLQNKKINSKNFNQFINLDEKKIKWSSSLNNSFIRGLKGDFRNSNLKISSYRPFIKSYLYFDKMFNDRCSSNPKIWFDSKGQAISNKVICVSGVGAKVFSILMTDAIPDRQIIMNAQSFPLYYFDNKGILQDGINDTTLNKFQTHYKDESIKKEDIFYYIYGVLHSKEYQERFKDNLSKSLPHIPFCKDFKGFSRAGKELSDLHLNYENQDKLKTVKILKGSKEVSLNTLPPEDLKVTKMKMNKKDKSIIQFNNHIMISNIPKESFDYKVNQWSAIKWVMERYQVKTDKKTGITNDPNAFSDDPAYILKLLLSVITLSVKTKEIVNSLPSVDLGDLEAEVNWNLLLKRTLVYTMMSDGKIKEVEKTSVSSCYKMITNHILPHAEINSHHVAFNEEDWSKESLINDFLNCDLSGEIKLKILKSIIKVTISDQDADRKEIEFLEEVADIIQFPKDKLQELVSNIYSKAS